MRRILLAMTMFALCLPAGAEAARRDERTPQPNASRIAQPAPQARPIQVPQARPAAPSPARPMQARQVSAQPQPAPRRAETRSSGGGLVMRGASAATVPREAAGSCTRRDGRMVCASRGVAGWQAGLPRADNAQRECPAGTLATLARGHDDVVRCLPL